MKAVSEGFIEALLIIIHFPSNLLKPFIYFDKINTKSTKKYPIVLVERWFSRNIFHLVAKKYLEHKGFKVYSLNYPMLKGTFEDSAENLATFINKHQISDAILIGISAGATTCLEYVQFHNGWEKTHLFVSIGGSLNGSSLAKYFPISTSLRQLIPGSLFMKHLHSEKIENLDKIITIRAKGDNMVPAKSSTLSGARNITIDVVGHNLLHTFWLPTYQLVREFSKD